MKTVKKYGLRFSHYSALMGLEDWSFEDICNFVKDTCIFAVSHFGYMKFIQEEMEKYGLTQIEVDLFMTDKKDKPYDQAHKIFRDGLHVSEPAGKEPHYWARQ